MHLHLILIVIKIFKKTCFIQFDITPGQGCQMNFAHFLSMIEY